MKLAKPHLDVALMTDRAEPMLRFWQDEVGLAYEEPRPKTKSWGFGFPPQTEPSGLRQLGRMR